jgi:predicted DCC family thiol-disulfide oxidoreductase YuxK
MHPMTVPVVRFTVAGEEAPKDPGREFTVVYDGTCDVCTRLSQVLGEWDRRGAIEIVSSQTPGVSARFPWILASAYTEALQLVGPGGETWEGAAAIEELLHILPRGRFIRWIFRVPFVRHSADRFYKWFARNRYRMGCGAHCQSRPGSVIARQDRKAKGG